MIKFISVVNPSAAWMKIIANAVRILVGDNLLELVTDGQEKILQ